MMGYTRELVCRLTLLIVACDWLRESLVRTGWVRQSELGHDTDKTVKHTVLVDKYAVVVCMKNSESCFPHLLICSSVKRLIAMIDRQLTIRATHCSHGL